MNTSKHPNLDDFLLSDGLPPPWDNFSNSLDTSEDLSVGARKIATFFRNLEERISADDLLLKFIGCQKPKKVIEYILFCFFDTGFPYLQIAQQALRLKCIRRLLMRMNEKCMLTDEEIAIAEELKKNTGINSVPALLSCAYQTNSFVSKLTDNRELNDQRRKMIVFLINAEVKSLRYRIDKISDSVDVYSLKEMARILPRMRVFDENAKDASDLAKAIIRKENLGKRALSFEIALKHGSFEKWLKALKKHPELTILHDAFVMQRKKLVPARSLVALTSLCRWITESKGDDAHPLQYINQAMNIYENGKFKVDADIALDHIRDFVDNSGAWIDGSIISGSFSDKLYSQWIGNDMLTRPFELPHTIPTNAPEHIKDLISKHIDNARLIIRLLDSYLIYDSPGLVEYIAKRSHSVLILEKIASTNQLYSGASNRGVPKALLMNPAPIPIDLIRQFLKPSFFKNVELKALLASAPDMRPAVVMEIKEYLGVG